jgi:hypothetical protein
MDPYAVTTMTCTECGADATLEVLGLDDQLYLLCLKCREAFEEAETRRELEGKLCEDCQFRPADHIFYHMKKGQFCLCERCWTWADHEDDYLDYCECPWPAGDPMDITCMRCRRSLREAKSHCACEKPTVTESEQQDCRACGGRISSSHQTGFVLIEDSLT